MGILQEDLCTFMIVSRWILLRMRNFSGEFYRENQNTLFIFNTFSENRAVYEITWKKFVDPGMPRLIHFACWITKATNSYSEFVILIAFPQRQRVRECASALHYAYIVCLLRYCVRCILQSSLLSSDQTRQLYRLQSLHLPGHLITAAVLRTAITEKRCVCDYIRENV